MPELDRETVQALWRLCQDFLTFDASLTLLVPIPGVGAGTIVPVARDRQPPSVSLEDQSAKMPRLPIQLHRKLHLAATMEGKSLNQLIKEKLEQAV